MGVKKGWWLKERDRAKLASTSQTLLVAIFAGDSI